MSVHSCSNIDCLTNILHTTYITHHGIDRPLLIAIITLVATMEFSIVDGAGNAVIRIKGGTVLYIYMLFRRENSAKIKCSISYTLSYDS